jgi:hypothetical protein
MRIIGFGHRKRVGKDTAAKFTMNLLRAEFRKLKSERLSFGDQLKDISHRMFGWGGLECGTYYSNHPNLIEVILPALGKSPRQIWDEMGLTGRNIHPNVWVNMAAHSADGDVCVSPDLRFPTEIELIRKFGGIAIKIENPRAPRVETAVDEALDSYTGWDAEIINDGTMREFHQQVMAIVRPYLEKEFSDA